MKRYNHKMSISKLICPWCKNIFPIPRMNHSNREKGHVKTIWCPFCKDTRDMVECRAHDTYVDILDVLKEESTRVCKESCEQEDVD